MHYPLPKGVLPVSRRGGVWLPVGQICDRLPCLCQRSPLEDWGWGLPSV